MKYYTTIKIEEIDLINWSIPHNEKETVRYSIDGTRFLVSFNEEHINYFIQFNGISPMDHATAFALMLTPEWFIQDTES